ncbi:hypothetical protein Tco_0691000, partial [Tanacetum coccineum]
DIVPLLPAMLAGAAIDQGNTSESAEASIQLKELMVLVPSLVTRVTSLEKELKDTKQTLGNDVLKLVKKVKSLEKALKRKSKKEIVSASEGEELEDQGRIIQDIDDYPLVSLVRESMKEKSTDFVTPTKASGEAQEEEEISPTILEAAKTLSKVASQSVSKAKSTDKGKKYKRRARSMAKKINTELDAEDEINTGRVKINSGIKDVNTGSFKVDTSRTSISTSNRGTRSVPLFVVLERDRLKALVVRLPLVGDEILLSCERYSGVVKTCNEHKGGESKWSDISSLRKFSRYRLAPLEMQELSKQLRELQDKVLELLRKEKLYAKFTKSEAVKNLEEKGRMKPRRVRMMAMTIQYGVRGMILTTQSEAFKQENILAEILHGLDQQMERKGDKNASLHVPLDEIKVDKTLHFVVEPIENSGRKVKRLKCSRIVVVKVHLGSKRGKVVSSHMKHLSLKVTHQEVLRQYTTQGIDGLIRARRYRRMQGLMDNNDNIELDGEMRLILAELRFNSGIEMLIMVKFNRTHKTKEQIDKKKLIGRAIRLQAQMMKKLQNIFIR